MCLYKKKNRLARVAVMAARTETRRKVLRENIQVLSVGPRPRKYLYIYIRTRVL